MDIPKTSSNNDTNLDQTLKLLLTRRQWTVIFNILVNREYRLGDASIVLPIIDALRPIVAFDTNIKPKEAPKDAPIITKKLN